MSLQRATVPPCAMADFVHLPSRADPSKGRKKYCCVLVENCDDLLVALWQPRGASRRVAGGDREARPALTGTRRCGPDNVTPAHGCRLRVPAPPTHGSACLPMTLLRPPTRPSPRPPLTTVLAFLPTSLACAGARRGNGTGPELSACALGACTSSSSSIVGGGERERQRRAANLAKNIPCLTVRVLVGRQAGRPLSPRASVVFYGIL